MVILDYLIKILIGFLVKSDLDDILYVFMREVSFMGLGGRGSYRDFKKGRGGNEFFWERLE